MRLCLGVDQIGQAFHLRQIQPPVFQSTAREFTGFRWPQPYRGQRLRQRLDHAQAAMHLQFNTGFTGKAGAFVKDQHQGFVQDLPLPNQLPQSRMTGHRNSAQARQGPMRLRARHPHHRHTRLAPRRG